MHLQEAYCGENILISQRCLKLWDCLVHTTSSQEQSYIEVCPNPANGKIQFAFNLSSSEGYTLELIISDLLGRKVLVQEITNTANDVILDTGTSTR